MATSGVVSLLGEQRVLRNDAQSAGPDCFAAKFEQPPEPGAGPLTAEIWLRTFDAGTVLQWVAAAEGLRIDVAQNGAIELYYGSATTPSYQTQPTSIADGDWHHLRVVRETWTVANVPHCGLVIALDGVVQLVQSLASLEPVQGVTRLVLGGRAEGTGYQPLRASFADVRIWRIAISEEQSGRWACIRLPATEWNDQDLLGYWDFAGTGDAVTDRSSYALSGTLGAQAGLEDVEIDDTSPSYALEVTGGDLQRSGRSAGAEVAGAAQYSFGTGAFTLEGWVQTRSGGWMVCRGLSAGGSGTAGYGLGVDSAGYLRLLLQSPGVHDDIKSLAATDALDNEWHHLAATRDAAQKIVLYLDGVPLPATHARSAADLSPGTGVPLGLAAPGSLLAAQDARVSVPAARQQIAMRLDEVRLWNVARSADEIFATMTRPPVAGPSLAGSWCFQTANVLDTSPNQNTALVSLSGRLRPNGDNTLIQPAVSALKLGSRQGGVSIPMSGRYQLGSGDFTVEAWVQANAGTAGPVLSTWDGTAGLFLYLHADGGIELHPLTGKIAAALNDGGWHHVAVTRSAMVSVYVDGVRLHESASGPPVSITSTAAALTLGLATSLPTGYARQYLANAAISQVRLWCLARTHADVQAWRLFSVDPEEKGLVGSWTFDHQAPVDRSAVANSGSLTGNRVQIARVDDLPLSPRPSVLVLSGQSARVGCGSGLGFAGGASYTLEAWIRPRTVGSGCIVSKFDSAGVKQYWLGLKDGRLAFSGPGGSILQPAALSSFDLRPGQWYHVAAVFSAAPANQLRLFVDGSPASVAVACSPATSVADGTPVLIGANANGTNVENPFAGDVHSVRIWSRARTADDLRGDLFASLTGAEPGLAACWDFSQAEAHDRTGSVSTTTRQGGAIFLAGDRDDRDLGSALLLDGNGQYVDCGTAGATDLTRAKTFEMWIKPDLDLTGTLTLLSQGTSLRIGLSDKALPTLQVAGLDAALTGTRALPLGSWSHLAAIYEPASRKLSLVVDGQSAGSRTATGTALPSSGALVIGADAAAPASGSFAGQMAEVRIWDGAVGAEEIDLHRSARAAGNQTIPATADDMPSILLVGYWPLSQSAGGQMLDLSTRRRNGLLRGGASLAYTDLRLAPPLPKIHAQARLIQDWDAQDESAGRQDGHTAFRTVIQITNPDGSLVGRQVRLRVWGAESGNGQGAGFARLDRYRADHPAGPGYDLCGRRLDGRRPRDRRQRRADPERRGPCRRQLLGDTTLSCNPLKIWADFMPPEDRVVIAPDEHLHRSLTTVTGSQLQSGPSPLMPSATFKSADADAVAEAIRSMAATVKQGTTLKVSRFLHLGASLAEIASGDYLDPDVQSQQWDVNTMGGDYGHRVETGDAYTAWELILDAGTVTYTTHTQESVEQRLVALGVTAPPLRFEAALQFGGLGSLWKKLKQGASDLKNVVVRGVEAGVHVVFSFAQESLNVIISTAKQVGQSVFGFLSSILQKYLNINLEEAARKILDFFRQTFDWDDILRTQKVLAGLLGQFEGLANQALDIAEAQAEAFLVRLGNDLHTRIEDVLKLLGTESPNQLALSSGAASASPNGVENRWMLEKIKSSAEATSDEAPQPPGTSELQDFFQQFLDDCKVYLVDNPAAHRAFSQAFEFFGEAQHHPASFFQLALSGLLKVAEAMGQLAIGAAQVLVKALIRLLRLLVRHLADLLATRIEIPLLTWLFEKKLTHGQPLTPNELVALTVAIPSTIAYKVAHPTHAAPFTEDDVKRYESCVLRVPAPTAIQDEPSAQPAELPASFAAKPAPPRLQETVDTEKEAPYFFAVCYATNWAAYSILDTWSDGASAANKDVPTFVRCALMTCQAMGSFLGPPTGGPGFPEPEDKTTAYRIDWVLWGLKLAAPVVDTALAAIDLRKSLARRVAPLPDYGPTPAAPSRLNIGLLRNLDPVGPCVYGCYGAILLALTAIMAKLEIDDAGTDETKKLEARLKLAQNIGEATPVLIKLLKIVPPQTPVGKVLHGVVLAIDVLGDGLAFSFATVRANRLRPAKIESFEYRERDLESGLLRPLSRLSLKRYSQTRLRFFALTDSVVDPKDRDISDNRGLSFVSNDPREVDIQYDASTHWTVMAGKDTEAGKLWFDFRGKRVELPVRVTSSTALSSIAVQPKDGESPTLAVGEKRSFRAIGTYADGSKAEVTLNADWKSDKTSILQRILTSAWFEARAAGSATITATAGTVSGSLAVTVQAAKLASLELSTGNPRISRGRTLSLSAKGNLSDGSTSTPTATWSIEDTDIATVSSAGVVTAVAEGVATLVASSGGQSARTLITVIPETFTQLIVTPDLVDPLHAGRSIPITAQARSSGDDELPVTEQAAWTSSNPAVATVNSSGVVTARPVQKKTQVGITAVFQKLQAAASVTVAPAILDSISVAAVGGSTDVPVGSTLQLAVTGVMTDGGAATFTSGQVSYSCADPAIATVNPASGLVTGVATGDATVIAAVTTPAAGTLRAEIILSVSGQQERLRIGEERAEPVRRDSSVSRLISSATRIIRDAARIIRGWAAPKAR